MRGYLILAAFVGVCLARPDIGLKLRQQGLAPPATNYGVPVGYLPPTGGDNSGSHQHNYYQSQGTSGSRQEGGQQISHTHGSDSQSGGHYQGGSSFGSSGSSGSFSQSGFSNERHDSQSTLVNKHIYFFDSPEDIPAPKIRIRQQQAQAKKDYNIIFIKAPNYQAPQVEIDSKQQLKSEKTIVYVLVKNPKEIPDIELPSIRGSKPSKPEVFFIKYDNKHDAQEKIQHIQNGGSADGIVSTDLGNDASFVSSIRDDSNNLVVTRTGDQGGAGEGHDSVINYGSDGYEHGSSGTSGSGHVLGYEHGMSGSSGTSGSGHVHGYEHATSGTSGSGHYTDKSISGPYKK